MFRLLEKLRAAKKRLDQYPRTWLEFDEEGFVMKAGRWPLHPWERRVRWGDVHQIDAVFVDCFIGHSVALIFYGPWKRPVWIYEDKKGWSSLLAEAEKRYAGFNRHNLSEIEEFWPGEACLPCWDKTKPVGDLELRKAEKRIVWASDGSTFHEWK